ncbi:MAG: nucleoside triphosphate pyrophosphohydrolase [Janthinobacterium lividum]
MPEPATTPIDTTQQKAGEAVAEAAAIMARLRGPEGCPWDREQTFDSIKRHTLEETYEVFDAIERRAWPELRDELGDLLLQVLFYAQMAEEAGFFSLRDVGQALSAKLIRRHPHIFGEAVATDADAVLRNWEQIKQEEKRGNPDRVQEVSALDSIARSMPAMLEAGKIGSKAAKAGFDWPDASGLFEKLKEESIELHAEFVSGDQDAMEAEMGDLLFTAVNLARHLRVDPESALRRTNAKFRSRYGNMERLAGSSEAFDELSLQQKEALWVEAKAAERQPTEVQP